MKRGSDMEEVRRHGISKTKSKDRICVTRRHILSEYLPNRC